MSLERLLKLVRELAACPHPPESRTPVLVPLGARVPAARVMPFEQHCEVCNLCGSVLPELRRPSDAVVTLRPRLVHEIVSLRLDELGAELEAIGPVVVDETAKAEAMKGKVH